MQTNDEALKRQAGALGAVIFIASSIIIAVSVGSLWGAAYGWLVFGVIWLLTSAVAED